MAVDETDTQHKITSLIAAIQSISSLNQQKIHFTAEYQQLAVICSPSCGNVPKVGVEDLTKYILASLLAFSATMGMRSS